MSPAFPSIGLLTLIVAAVLASPPAPAESSGDVTPTSPEGVESRMEQRARPILRSSPIYPLAAMQDGDEGTVALSFVVTPDGSVADPLVEVSSGNRLLDRAAVAAVRRWQYEPALLNGQPVQQCEVRTSITFHLAKPGRRALGPRFMRELQELSRLAEAGQAGEAVLRAERMIETRSVGRERLNQFEWTRLWVLKASLDTRAGAPPAVIVDSLRRALANPASLGSKELQRALMENLLKHEIDLREYGRATSTLAGLLELVPPDEQPQWLQQLGDELSALMLDPRPLPSTGRIPASALADDQLPFWTHQPLRRSFGIEITTGQLAAVDIRCEWHRSLSSWASGHTWELPADWGNCDIYVYGAPGTTFTLVEHPLEQA